MILNADIPFNIFATLDTVGFMQGTLLGIVLIIISRNKYKCIVFLGLFLLLYSLQRVPVILNELDLFKDYPNLLLLPFNANWILTPLFFVYTQQMSVFSNKKTVYWVLFPGIFFYVAQLFIYLLPYETKIYIIQFVWLNVFNIVGVCYGWIIVLWNLKLLSKHEIEINNFFSLIENKELKWARAFLIFNIVGSILYMLQYYLIQENLYARIFFILFDLTTIYWLSYYGIKQRHTLSLITKKEMFSMTENNSFENELNSNKYKNVIKEIDNYMMTSLSYLHKELSVFDLAKALKIHPRKISTAINKEKNENFNTYVNKFRIKRAEMLLKDEETENLSIEGIGNEVGFHSKSAFYSAFKKITGTTPSKYKSEIAY